MCLKPISIPNPYFGRSAYASEQGSLVKIPRKFISNQEYIEVPCGKCADCTNSYFTSLLQRALVESQSSYMYFITLTYDNKHIPSIVLPNGKEIFYSDYKDIQNLFKRLRNAEILDRDFRYLVACEYGDNNHRPHFHILLFVAKLDDDSPSEPYYIANTLKAQIKHYYAVNIGTRKNPIYEPLFTHATRRTPTGFKTNYFVKYVEPSSSEVYSTSASDTTYIKTIRYLIGYVNKASRFDTIVNSFIDEFNQDSLLVAKLKNLLKSKVRYSKGFGCGFMDGVKIYLPKISVRASSNTLFYTDLIDNLPRSFERFAELYPEVITEIDIFLIQNRYSNYSSYSQFLENLSTREFYIHSIILYYFPRYFSLQYDTYYRVHNLQAISTFFSKDKYSYSSQVVRSFDIVYSDTYKFLRKGVEAGFNAKLTFFAFPLLGSQNFTALCKFYKDRVILLSDFERLYNSLNVCNYDEWKQLFQQQYSLRNAHRQGGNEAKYEESREKICEIQKNVLSSSRKLEGIDIYRELLTNCKH